MGSGSVVNFDLSGESSNSYFKSSFARSMAFGSTSQSKSLDYVYLDEGKTISEEAEVGQADGVRSPKSMIVEPLETSTPRKPRRSVPTLPTYELAAFPRELSASVRLARSRPNMTAGTLDPIKFWKMKQEAASKQSESTTYSTEESTILQEESKDDEILRLRKALDSSRSSVRKRSFERILLTLIASGTCSSARRKIISPSVRNHVLSLRYQKNYTFFKSNNVR
ncbi:unnamed protein product [Nesidiocoris tenuis]|uniref:Uncharacterized protein n=1 Tax=Nesidiocoris tenuis TaxID=355587 RepID=A0A6H5HLD4_9HEMI|nr:unnamed protein product [Nesidiocoris tenuis]CAB0019094.1 unnamed protein product [Nesidiocoris tenuis]